MSKSDATEAQLALVMDEEKPGGLVAGKNWMGLDCAIDE